MNHPLHRSAPFLLAVVLLGAGCKREATPQSGMENLQSAFPDSSSNPAIALAIAAARTNDLGVGVITLQEAKRTEGLSAQQLQSVEQASQALVTELLRRAAAGDARARADLELIERSRSQ
jgi:hypothetical protein